MAEKLGINETMEVLDAVHQGLKCSADAAADGQFDQADLQHIEHLEEKLALAFQDIEKCPGECGDISITEALQIGRKGVAMAIDAWRLVKALKNLKLQQAQ